MGKFGNWGIGRARTKITESPNLSIINQVPSMRIALAFVIFVFMVTNVVAQQATSKPTSNTAPQAITDPRQLQSKSNSEIQQGQLSIERLYMTRAVGGTAWSPDGKQIAFVSNISGQNNIWIVPSEGGWPVQFTVSDQRQASPAWSPNGKFIAFQSDYNGNEQWDVFVVNVLTGEVTNVTNTPEISEESPAWSPDGRYLAYSVKPKTSPTYEIEIMDFLTRKVRHMTTATPPDWGNVSPIWSRDGKWIAYAQQHASGKDSNIYVVEVATAKSTLLTPHSGQHNYQATDWSADGKKLLIGSNAGNGYDNAALLDIATKKIDWLTNDKWEVASGNYSPDGKLITWTANVDGNTAIYLYDVATGRARQLPMPAGVDTLGGSESAFSRDGSKLMLYHNGPDAPNDVWVHSMRDGRTHQVTHSLIAGIRSRDLVTPFLVHYPGTDGKFTISALAYVPYNMQRDGRNAAVVYVHGGPTSQTINSFSRNIQYLVNAGYLVIAPNYRGSSGYGKEFQDANV
ncbi:MAG: S9 family peptidase, partial [Acidobacteriaceae bacterium]|nr:S9 family peptidase [Acidobacteriaceae bacterium]